MTTLNVPILYYHLIAAPPAGATRDSIYMEPARFDRQLGLLRWMGYRDIGLDEFMDCLEAGRAPQGRRVMITFDDGHLDNFTIARPILMRHGFRATIFVVAGRVGARLPLRASVDPTGEPIMTREQLRQMADEGFDIQSHGMTHANLAHLDDGAARDEIERSKAVLEEMLGRPVRYFAYPYGSFKPRHMAMVERAGYRAALSTVRGRSHALAERFCLKRIPIHHHRGPLGFIHLVRFKSYQRAQAQLDRLRAPEEMGTGPVPAFPTRPLNVVRIISFLTVGGVQSMLLSTLPSFDRRRFNLRVVCTARSGEVGAALQRQGIQVDVVKMPSRLSPLGLWRLARWLRAARADIVHTHMYASNISGVLAARLAGVPVIVSHIHSEHEWRSRARGWMDRACDRLRSGSIAVSAAARDAFFSKTGLHDMSRVHVLHNAARPMSEKSVDVAALRAELGIPPGCPVVGTVTRLVAVKGLDVLVRAARRVVARLPEARFVLVGRGKEREALLRQIAELKLEGRVILSGERLDVEGFYQLFDCFVLSSRSEGCPNVILEAMRMGLPIVATRVGGVPELVRDGVSGLLAPYGDDEALAGALARVLTEPDLARRLGDAAREASREFTAASYVARMETFYQEWYERAMRERRPYRER